jgi:probable F420-dependent oxidoreductase
MKVGAFYFFTDDGPNPAEFARQAEAMGFDSLFVPEHSHFPVTRKTPYPARYGGGELPDFYLHNNDAIVTLSYIAAVTKTLRLGTGINLLAQHDPLWTAKELATLDMLSGGRVACGVGWGWNQDEAEAHGVVWKDRIDIVRDKVAIMRALWRDEVASYEGTHVSLEPSWAWPKPHQSEGIPIYLGGTGPRSMKETALWADAWYPAPPPSDPTLEVSIPKFRQVCEDNGRDPATVKLTVGAAPPDRAILEKYRELGVEEVSVWVDPAAGDQGLRNLEAVNEVREALAN